MKFSLIVPTLNRLKEVEDLLKSISLLVYKDFEVIIVDQNQDNRLEEIINFYSKQIKIVYKKVDFKGAARARNFGVKFSTGDIINFPDDDCELHPNILDQVEKLYKEDNELDVIFGKSIDKDNLEVSVVKFQEKSDRVQEENLYKTTVEFTMFIKRGVFERLGGFDETLGVGTFFGAEEGADLVLRAIYINSKIIYKSDLIFYHPQKIQNYDPLERNRAFNYGKGFGRLSSKHFYQYKNKKARMRYLKFQYRSFLGVGLNLILGRFQKSLYYIKVLQGRRLGRKISEKEYKYKF
ncbi:glycosyltransferase family 2 protein [Bacillus pacificus]|uniref:glycosyltransferase family 2 protein n=1 Tax=Bacillus cereus group TaxID=86661 RepID=UPI0009369752|nr:MULTISPECIES: glycosyltransferase family A protein [Bacillus cereus group]ASI80514.1 hypothetical protein BA202_25845 [Bacillus cereus]MCC2484138.1 glycosyltransferase family 2 protein [Bacillus pacificus]MDA1608860.1 glycosyltransferase family A protein [Bacillus cereus group sp. TH208-1LC]MDA2140088.1 glycosyltransferase family A protein [Bacillus cereus group sp. Bc256]MED1648979.1 glycosyltransferase family A protein [Bacillus pacificus]